jgi:hypothetical protein
MAIQQCSGGGGRFFAEPRDEVFVHAAGTERAELDRVHTLATAEFVQGMRGARFAELPRGPIRADREHAQRVPSARQVADQAQRRGIAPVEILEHQQKPPAPRQNGECVDQLAKHAFLRAAGPRGRSGARLRPERQLVEPRGRMAIESVDHLVAVRRATQARERLQHRHEGLFAPVVFDALAVSDLNVRLRLEAVLKLFDQSRLANAGFTRDEGHRGLLRQRGRERLLEHLELQSASYVV